MRNKDHLPSSPPFDPVADIGDDLKAIRQDVAAVCASLEALRVYDAIDRAHQEDAWCQQLLAKQAARAHQEAAAACARQEAAAARDLPGRASHDDDDAKDEYEDVTGRFFTHVDTTMAKIQAMDDGFENWAAAEKALANKANERERTAAREKAWAGELRQMTAWENALADETHELRQAAAREKALVDEADKLRQAAALEKALADKANKQCRANTLKKALANKAYERRRTATRKKVLGRSRPCLHVGRRHGPRAPNTQEYLLCGWRHRPRAPNQSTVNGWA
jgi:hypothetical protein